MTTIEHILGGPFVVLDTETTGLGSDARIVDLAIISSDGQVILDTLIHPQCPIAPDAAAIHGIDDLMVEDAPSLDQVWPSVLTALTGRTVIAYNVDFDRRVLSSEARRLDLEPWIFSDCAWHCAMKWYARASYRTRWCSLRTACTEQEIEHITAHRALGDARATLALIQRLAGVLS